MESALPPDQELNPWLAAEACFEGAAARLGLDDGLSQVLRPPGKEITVQLEATVAATRTLSLAEAAADIRRTCHRRERPFFFMVRAGISCPAIPQASDIVEHCKKEAEGAQAPAGQSPMESYEWLLEKTYASPADRQQ